MTKTASRATIWPIIFPMPLPSFRNSRSKVRRRRSHHALKAVDSTACQNCGATILPHRACKKCGFYKGRSVRPVSVAAADKTIAKAVGKKAEASAPAVSEEKAAKKAAPKRAATRRPAKQTSK